MTEFIHLHNHTSYSLLDGACRLGDLFEMCKIFKMDALAITDHGNMFGVINFYTKAKQEGIKPIIGAEVYIAPKSRFEKSKSQGQKDTSYHLILLAKNFEGYKNLMKLVSIGFLEGFYYKPRIDKEVLKQYSSGLVALSACIKGEVPRLILRDDFEGAEQAALGYKELFGEDYYFELHRHEIPEEEKAIQGMLKLSQKLDIPVVATNDIHYLKHEHVKAHEILLCIQTGKTIKDDSRMKFNTDQVYFKSPQQMKELFEDIPEAIENTVKIAEKCNLELDTKKIHLPDFDVPKEYQNLSLDEYLAHLAEEGLHKRFSPVTQKLKDRLSHELKIIKKMGYAGYFLIVKDFIDYARQKEIPVGPGRGSAAGSLVSYCLRITNINPIEYDLLFERFLNPDRVSMPDIDIDFCYERREQIIRYVKEKYGEDNVTQIITFGTMAARGVIRDVGRVIDMSLPEVDKIAKMVPQIPKKTLEEALAEVPELREIAQQDDLHQTLIENSKVLEGLHRHASTHAAGVVVTPEELTNYTPLFKSSQGDVTTQYDMKSLEKIGLLKMDFLGLRTLTVIDDTLKHLKKRGIELDIDNLPLDDQKTLDIFGEGETVGVFQFESSAMRDWLRKLKPQHIGDLIAMNALYRPGPMEMIPDFINRRHGRTKIEYLHEKLEPILKETYGVMVYQEQVMRVASELSGFTMSMADELRRAMGKKIKHLMDKLSALFIEGAVKNGISEHKAKQIYKVMVKFAEYGFNKSHAAGYSVIAYQTAYLKAHYSAEFMAANMTSEMNNTDRIVILMEECKRSGIKVLPPDINESEIEFSVVDQNIRYGLKAIKNVGTNAIKSILKARKEHGKFKTIFDLCERCDLRLINKRVLESLIQAGAMDSLEGHRAQLMQSIDIAVPYSQKSAEQKRNGQTSIFDAASGDENAGLPELPQINNWSEKEQLTREKETLSFYFSGHPLSRHAMEIQLFSKNPLNSIPSLPDKSKVVVGVMITQVKKHLDRKNRDMAFVTIEDLTGSSEMLVFSDAYQKYAALIEEDSLVFITGKVSSKGEKGNNKIICEEVIPLSQVWRRNERKVYLNIEIGKISEDAVYEIKNLLSKNKGTNPIYLNIITPKNGNCVLRSKKIATNLNPDLAADLAKQVGTKNIWTE